MSAVLQPVRVMETYVAFSGRAQEMTRALGTIGLRPLFLPGAR
jgi:hypothetical protein